MISTELFTPPMVRYRYGVDPGSSPGAVAADLVSPRGSRPTGYSIPEKPFPAGNLADDLIRNICNEVSQCFHPLQICYNEKYLIEPNAQVM